MTNEPIDELDDLDEIGARAEELPELDVGGAEPRQRRGYALISRYPPPERPCQQPDRRCDQSQGVQRRGGLGSLRHEAHAILREHDAGPAEPEKMCEGGEQRPVNSA